MTLENMIEHHMIRNNMNEQFFWKNDIYSETVDN